MTEFFIIENSFLIRSALTRLLQGIVEKEYIHELRSFEEIYVFKGFCEDSAIIINENLLPDDYETVLSGLEFHNYRLLLICCKKESLITEYDFICMNEDHDSIMNKLEKLSNSSSKLQKTNGKKALSERETDILKFVALGLTNKEIAEKLFLSTHTVIAHRKNISAKLGIKTIAGFTVYALLNNIIQPYEINND